MILSVFMHSYAGLGDFFNGGLVTFDLSFPFVTVVEPGSAARLGYKALAFDLF